MTAPSLRELFTSRVNSAEFQPDVASYTEAALLGLEYAADAEATMLDIPERQSVAEVESTPFTLCPNPAFGDMQQKEFWKDPDGHAWVVRMGNPAAEAATAAASAVLALVGVPAVPVYFATVQGRRGAWHPLIMNTGILSPVPTEYSQHQVDTLVRMHAALTAVGLDRMPGSNIMALMDGTPVPIDLGRAFATLPGDDAGQDPSASRFGDTTPAWDHLYEFARVGLMPDGVQIHPNAAIEIFDQLDSLSAAEWAALCGPYLSIKGTDESVLMDSMPRARAITTSSLADFSR